MRASSIVASVLVIVMLGAMFGGLAGNASANQGARDSFGYRWTDSKSTEPNVTFNWVDISGTGTASGVTGDDSSGGAFAIGFNFSYYGNVYTSFYISTNGFISFGGGSSSYTNRAIPYTGSPNNFIAAYWDDLTATGGTIYYQTIGTEPYRSLVVEYYQVRLLGNSNLMTFEIILNETGDIWLQYLTLNGMTGSWGTVGMENSGGTVGTQYSYNTASLTDNLAIRLSLGSVVLAQSQEQSGKPGEVMSYNLTVTNRQTFSDSFAVNFSGVQGWTVGLYDASMTPLIDNDGDLIPDTGTIGSLASVNLTVTVSIPISPASNQELTTVNVTSFANASANDSCVLTTDVLDAWFTPPHSDSGWDTDLNGEYDYLFVNASVEVRTAGWFYVYGYLYTVSDLQIGYDTNYTYLSVGSHIVELRYYGWDIREHGIDGPYHADLILRDGSWVQLDQDVHFTSAYLDTNFMQIPGILLPPFSDYGVDSDANSLYDNLVINVSVDINYAGDFRVTTYLYDDNWNPIRTLTTDVNLGTGISVVQMSFDAWDISKYGIDGAFHSWTYLYGWVDGSWYNTDAESYTTGTYLLASFERPPALFHSPHNEHVNDTDGDAQWDSLTIDVVVNVTVEGSYSITGRLYDWWGTTIDTVTNTTHLDVGEWVVELVYAGWPIRYNGEDGPFDVDLTLMNGTTELDTDSYSTSNYWYTAFETAPGWFETPYDATGLDINADGLYDYLVANVTVNVTTAAAYEIHAHLRNSWLSIVEEQTNTTFLNIGANRIELRFTGWMIRSTGVSGTFTVLLWLYDSGSRQLDSDSFTTPSFLYTQFQGQPATLNPPHGYQAVDDDSDGSYERFVVNVSVDVAAAGLFFIEGYLYDDGWGWISTSGVWSTLATGIQTVQLSFPGYMIYAHGFNGTFIVYLELMDASQNYLDGDYVYTLAYNFDSFDPTAPSIDAGWAVIAPTIDGVFSANEWADATVVDLKAACPLNEIAGTLMVMNDGTMLYIGIDAFGDMSEDNGDTSSIAFDTDNDNSLTDAREDQFALQGWSWNSQDHYVYDTTSSTWQLDCSPFDQLLAGHSGLAGAMGFGTSTGHASEHRIYEYSIPLTLLGTSPGDSIGFLGRDYTENGVLDSHTGMTSDWPTTFSSQPMVSQFGEIHLALTAPTPPPTTTAIVAGTSGLAGWYKSATSVTLSATGGKDGLNYTQYRLNGSSTWTTYNAAIQLTTEGTFIVEFRSVDNAAQTETTRSVTVNIDLAAPIANHELIGSMVWVNATDSMSGVDSIWYCVDGGTWSRYNGVITIQTAGTHTLDFYAVDAAGNTQSTQTVTIEIGSSDEPGSTSSFPLLMIGLIAAIVAALVIVFLLFRRKKGPEQAPIGPMTQGVPVQYQAPPPPPNQ